MAILTFGSFGSKAVFPDDWRSHANDFNGRFNVATCVAVCPSNGDVYVLDALRADIQVFTAFGRFKFAFGHPILQQRRSRECWFHPTRDILYVIDAPLAFSSTDTQNYVYAFSKNGSLLFTIDVTAILFPAGIDPSSDYRWPLNYGYCVPDFPYTDPKDRIELVGLYAFTDRSTPVADLWHVSLSWDGSIEYLPRLTRPRISRESTMSIPDDPCVSITDHAAFHGDKAWYAYSSGGAGYGYGNVGLSWSKYPWLLSPSLPRAMSYIVPGGELRFYQTIPPVDAYHSWTYTQIWAWVKSLRSVCVSSSGLQYALSRTEGRVYCLMPATSQYLAWQ